MIRKSKGKYVVTSHSGRKMGTYTSKQKAKERLAQIEMFKHMNQKKKR